MHLLAKTRAALISSAPVAAPTSFKGVGALPFLRRSYKKQIASHILAKLFALLRDARGVLGGLADSLKEPAGSSAVTDVMHCGHAPFWAD